MSQTYYAILTAIGEAKLANAAALNTTLKISKMAVGDGGGSVPTPDRSQTALKGEWYRAGLNSLTVDKANSSQVIAELVIPETTGGSWIREMGLIDADGNLIAVANTPPSYKPQLAEGSGRTQVLRMVLIVSSTSNVELKIDPSVVLATRGYVDDAITVAINRLDNKQSVRAATTANITLSGLQTIDGIALVAGDRVLVKNQTTGNGNGLYVAGTGGWLRAADADENAEVTPGLLVYVEQGATQADTIWKLTTDAPIALGSTALSFADITQGYAPIQSPELVKPSRTDTPAQFDNSKQLATAEFVQRALGNRQGTKVLGSASAFLASDAGKLHILNGNSGLAFTLPALSAVPDGATYQVIATVVGHTLSVSDPANEKIVVNGTTAGINTKTLNLNNGDTATLVKVASGIWYLADGSARFGVSAEFLDRTRSLAASITSTGVPAANAGFSWVKNFPPFVAPCDGYVVAQSNLNIGTGANGAAVSNVARIVGSQSGTSTSSDGCTNPMTNVATMRVVKGETVSITCSASSSFTNAVWQSMTHNTAYTFTPSNAAI